MEYTRGFEQRVLSTIVNFNIKDDILSGKMNLVNYLSIRAHKGINFKIFLNCLEKGNLEYLKKISLSTGINRCILRRIF